MSYQWKKRPSATESVTAKQRAFPTRPKLGRPVTDVDDLGRPRRRRGLFEVADESAVDTVDATAVVAKIEPTLTTESENDVTDELDDLNKLIAGRIDGEIDIDALDQSLQSDLEIDEFDIDIDGLADIASSYSEPEAPSFIDIELIAKDADTEPDMFSVSDAADSESMEAESSQTPLLSALNSNSTQQSPGTTDELVDDRVESEDSDEPYLVKPRILGERMGSGKKIRLFNRFKDSAPATFTNGSAIEIRATLPDSTTAADNVEASANADEPGQAASNGPDKNTSDYETRSADQHGSDDFVDATSATASVSSLRGRSSDRNSATAVNVTSKSKNKLSAPALSTPATETSPPPTGHDDDKAQKAQSLRKVVTVDDGIDPAASSAQRAEAPAPVVSLPVESAAPQPTIAADENVESEGEVEDKGNVTPPARSDASPTVEKSIESPASPAKAATEPTAQIPADQPAVQAQAKPSAETRPDSQKKIATLSAHRRDVKPDQQTRPAAAVPVHEAPAQDTPQEAEHEPASVPSTDNSRSAGRYTKALKRRDKQAAEKALKHETTPNSEKSAAAPAPATTPAVVSQDTGAEKARHAPVAPASITPASNDQVQKRLAGEKKIDTTLDPEVEVKYRNIQPAAIDALPEPIRKSIPAQLQSEKSVNKLLGADESSGTYTVFLPKLDTPKEQKPFGRDPIIMSLMIFSGLFLITAATGFLMSRDEGADRWIADRVATVKEQANELATNLQNLKPQAQPEEVDHESSIQPVTPQPVSPQPLADSQPLPAAQQPAPQPASAVETGAGDNVLTGTLISSNGEPVAGEQIVLMSPSLGARFTTTTRDDGEFALENLMPGTDYALNVTPTGPYKTLQVLDLSVSENNDHLPLTLEAMPTANLSGRIVDADNNAVPNYQLWATGFDEPGQQVNFRSDHEGNYRLYGLPTGKVQFTSKSEPKILITSVVLNGGSDTVVDLVVDYGPHEIGGIATDSDGNPLSGVEITLEWSVKRDDIRSMGTRTANSGPDGSFRFAELGPGKHFLTARADGLPLIRRSIDVGTDETEIALELGGVDPSSG